MNALVASVNSESSNVSVYQSEGLQTGFKSGVVFCEGRSRDLLCGIALKTVSLNKDQRKTTRETSVKQTACNLQM